MAQEMDLEEDMVLPHRYEGIPLKVLRVSSRKKISMYLNPEGSLNDDIGLMTDWQGLAELAGFDYLEIRNMQRLKSPTEELLNMWTERNDLNPTLGKLWKHLEMMRREDVLMDCRKLIFKDIDAYLDNKERQQDAYTPIQDFTVSQSESAVDHHINETIMMTTDDVKFGVPQMYDAFISYNPEGYDLQFVKRMAEVLEKPPYDLKLFVPWRNDLPGSSRYTIEAKLIESRCKRMVIIMSPNFLQSAACDFQIKFAHSLSPGSRSKKLIPVLIDPCSVPSLMRHVTLCDFTKRDLIDWFWERLYRAIQAPFDPEECRSEGNQEISQIELDTSTSEFRAQWSSSSSETVSIEPVISPSASSSLRTSGSTASLPTAMEESLENSSLQNTSSTALTSSMPLTASMPSLAPSEKSSEANPRREHLSLMQQV